MIVELAETEKHILVVTPQTGAMAPMLAVIETILQQIPTLAQPAEAMALAMSKSFDLLIVDMHKGTEHLPLIRDFKRKLLHVPLVAMVPYGDVDMVEQVLAQGADDYISQPIPLQRLKTTLRNALRTRTLLKHSAGHVAMANGHAHDGHLLFNAAGSLRSLREIEDAAIAYAIQCCDGCITQAARMLGIGRSTLYRKLQEKMSPQISRENQTTRPMMVVSAAGDS